LVEGPETVLVNLGTPSNLAVTVADGQGTGTINDTSTLTVSISDATPVNEGSSLVYTVSLTGGTSTTNITIPLTYAGTATPVLDYNGQPVSVTILAGATSATVTVPTLTDSLVEGPETVLVNLGTPSNLAVTVADGQGTGTINDTNILPPNFLIGSLITNSNKEVQTTILTIQDVVNPFHAYATYNVLDGQGQQGSLNKDVGFDMLKTQTFNGALEAAGGTKGIVTDFVLDGAIINASGGSDNVQLQVDGKINGDPTAITFAFTPDDRTTTAVNEGNVTQTQTESLDGSSASNTLNDPNPTAFNYLAGDAGNDTLNGGSGADILNGGAGADTVYGNAGNDILVYDSADTVLNGGAGIDLLRLDGSSPTGGSTVDLRGNIAISNIEGLLITDDTTSNPSAGTTVKLNAHDVLDFTSGNIAPDINTLHVLGNQGDILDLNLGLGADQFQIDTSIGTAGNHYADGNGFVHYTATTSSHTVTLLVDSNILVS
jgi:hypothetical protein